MSARTTGYMRIRNMQPHDLLVRLEPWCDEQVLAPDATVTVYYDGPTSKDLMEVEVGVGVITVNGWEGSILSLEP